MAESHGNGIAGVLREDAAPPELPESLAHRSHAHHSSWHPLYGHDLSLLPLCLDFCFVIFDTDGVVIYDQIVAWLYGGKWSAPFGYF